MPSRMWHCCEQTDFSQQARCRRACPVPQALGAISPRNLTAGPPQNTRCCYMPDIIDRSWAQALQCLNLGKEAVARQALDTIVMHRPNHTQAWLLLGGIAWRQDRIRDSVNDALKASDTSPTTAEAVCDVIAGLIQVGESAVAHSLLEQPLLQGALGVNLLLRLSGRAQLLGDHPATLMFLDRAGVAGASGANYLAHLGIQQTINGQLAQAEETLEACAKLDPGNGRAILLLSRVKKQTLTHNHLDQIQRGLQRVQGGGEEHAALEFARYKELEDVGRVDEAWQALASGNSIMRARLRHDSSRERRLFERLIAETSDWQASHDDSAQHVDGGPQPIFVLGMPRSGTTVLDRILDKHSQVRSAGELPDFASQMQWSVNHNTPSIPDDLALDRLNAIDFRTLGERYLERARWRAQGNRFFVDKLPANWPLTGLILRALPGARVLHMVRDPMDVCFSNYRALFGDSYPYSYDLPALASHYQSYLRVMRHWHDRFPGRILDVGYGELVADPERTAKRVFGFCDLDAEAGCVDIVGDGAVGTLSMVQVREPIHQRAAGQWRTYANQLQTLCDAIGG